MAKGSRQSRTKALVLHKTKLKESDLIFDILLPQGQKKTIVGKGARKPKSPFSARMELGSYVDVSMVEGRGLPILTEAQLIEVHTRLIQDFDLSLATCAACELLRVCAQQDLEQPYFFASARAFFAQLNDLEGQAAYVLLSSFLLKLFAYAGIRPHLDSCVICGAQRTDFQGIYASFSYEEGGFICPDCVGECRSELFENNVLDWVRLFLLSPFKDITSLEASCVPVLSLMIFIESWSAFQLGIRLKSMESIKEALSSFA